MVRAFSQNPSAVPNGKTSLEFAEYTSAQERIALGKKGRKITAKKKREEMENLIAETYGRPLAAWASLIRYLRLEDDEEEKEWEQEQIRRAGHRDHTPETHVPAVQVYQPSPSMLSQVEVNVVPSDPRSSSRDTHTNTRARDCTVEPNPLQPHNRSFEQRLCDGFCSRRAFPD